MYEAQNADHLPEGAVLCPGMDAGDYCDGTGDCTENKHFCECPEAVALCDANALA